LLNGSPPYKGGGVKRRYIMKIKCLSCGHDFELDRSYAEYNGQVKCNTCGTLLSVKIEDGMVKSSEIVALSKRVAGEEAQAGK